MQKCQEFNAYGLERLKKHLVNYVIINRVLLTIDLMGDEGLSWTLYYLLPFCNGLGLDA